MNGPAELRGGSNFDAAMVKRVGALILGEAKRMKNWSAERFVVLCGMPRCGTRQFTDFLNADERICIQGEIAHPILKKMADLIDTAEAIYATGNKERYFSRKKAAATAAMFAYFSKANPMFKRGATIQGFKTPNAEVFAPEIFQVLMNGAASVRFMYCIRNIEDCYLSLVAMPWFGQSEEQFIQRYLKSLRRALSLRSEVASSGAEGSLAVLNLDQFIRAKDQAKWIKEELFDAIGVPVTLERARILVDTVGNSNSTVNTTGVVRKKELSDQAYRVFERHRSEIEADVSEFNQRFDESLDTFKTR